MKTNLYLGINLGGTNCSTVLGRITENGVKWVDRADFATAETRDPDTTLARFEDDTRILLERHGHPVIRSVGVSCGGPLCAETGRILSPPNLPGWDDVPVVERLSKAFDCPVYLENDANAGALAEWRWGAGRGAAHMIFLTFGTGMGAGLILNKQLYRGACGLAGEVGHLRLAEEGPVGFGKAGSFEGFCSGGGIAKMARLEGLDYTHDAKTVFALAAEGDDSCRAIVRMVAFRLGRGLAFLIDAFNPGLIIVGGIYPRQHRVLEPLIQEELERETIPASLAACRILPAALGDASGDYAALAAAVPDGGAAHSPLSPQEVDVQE
jgi:glucokinase